MVELSIIEKIMIIYLLVFGIIMYALSFSYFTIKIVDYAKDVNKDGLNKRNFIGILIGIGGILMEIILIINFITSYIKIFSWF